MFRFKEIFNIRAIATAVAICPALAIVGLAQSAQSPPNLANADIDAGAEVFEAECNGCHSVSIAPTLRGVVGREVAGDTAYGSYSDALKAKKPMKWNAATLDAFMAAPQDYIPGTQMTKTIADPQVRANIIAFIQTLPPPQ